MSGASSMSSYHWESSQFSTDGDMYNFKKELPGRTMEFTFDLSQTPVIGRKTPTGPAAGPHGAAAKGSSSYFPYHYHGSQLTSGHSSLSSSAMNASSLGTGVSGQGSLSSAAASVSGASALLG